MIPMRHVLCVLVLSFCCVCGCVGADAEGETDGVGGDTVLQIRESGTHSEDREGAATEDCDGQEPVKESCKHNTKTLGPNNERKERQDTDDSRVAHTRTEENGHGTTHSLEGSPQSQSQPQPHSPESAQGVLCSTNSAGNTDPNCRVQTTAESSSPSPSERRPEGEQEPSGAGAKGITNKEGADGASQASGAKPDTSAPESDGEVSVSKGQPESNSNSADGNGTTETSSPNSSNTGSTSNSDTANNDNGTSPDGSESTSNPTTAGNTDTTTTTTTTTTTLPPELTNSKKGDADSSSSISSS
ncbi:uncharacterized protein TM35_000551150, partial [Trypanosoma theileri]